MAFAKHAVARLGFQRAHFELLFRSVREYLAPVEEFGNFAARKIPPVRTLNKRMAGFIPVQANVSAKIGLVLTHAKYPPPHLQGVYFALYQWGLFRVRPLTQNEGYPPCFSISFCFEIERSTLFFVCSGFCTWMTCLRPALCATNFSSSLLQLARLCVLTIFPIILEWSRKLDLHTVFDPQLESNVSYEFVSNVFYFTYFSV